MMRIVALIQFYLFFMEEVQIFFEEGSNIFFFFFFCGKKKMEGAQKPFSQLPLGLWSASVAFSVPSVPVLDYGNPNEEVIEV